MQARARRRSCRLQFGLGLLAVAACGPGDRSAAREPALAGMSAVANGGQAGSIAPVGDPIDAIASIAGDYLDYCAVSRDGALWCWGDNADGQLGDGTSSPRKGAVKVIGLSDVSQVAVGNDFACALRASKEVVCWGRGEARALGVPGLDRSNVPVTVQDVRNVKAIAARGRHACALLDNGKVKCWGELEKDGAIAIDGVADARSIAVGRGHACALLADQTLRCWGVELGLDLSGADYRNAVAIPELSGVEAVFAGESATCVQLASSVRCWGDNQNGELGDGTTTAAYRPVAMSGVAAVIQLAFGATHLCAIVPGGAVRCSGHGRIPGSASQLDFVTPTAVRGVDAALDVAAGMSSTCVLSSAGNVSCWDDAGGDPSLVTAALQQ